MIEFKNSFRKLVLVMVDIGGGCLEKLNERGWEASVLIFSVSVCIYIFQVAWIPATFLSTKLQKLLCLKKKKIRDTALPLFCLVLLARKVTRTPSSDGEVVFNTTGQNTCDVGSSLLPCCSYQYYLRIFSFLHFQRMKMRELLSSLLDVLYCGLLLGTAAGLDIRQ